MNSDKAAYLKGIIEWFNTFEDKSDDGLREALIGSMPDVIGKTQSQKVGEELAMIRHDFDHSLVRYHLRYKFAHSAKIDHKAIKELAKKFDVDEEQAKAIHFAEHYALCQRFEEEGLVFIRDYSMKVLKQAFLDIHKEGATEALRDFTRKSKSKRNSKQIVDFETIEEMVEHAHQLLKDPKMGRPPKVIDMSQSIVDGLIGLISSKIGIVNKDNIEDVLSGKISHGRITKTELSDYIGTTRPTLNKWFKKSNTTIQECVAEAELSYFNSLKEKFGSPKT